MDDQVRRALKCVGQAVEPSPDAAEGFAERLQSEHRARRVVAVVVTAVVVALAVVVPVVATRSSAGGGIPPAEQGAPGEFAAITGSGDAVLVEAHNGHTVGAPLASHALAISAIPGGGWVIAKRAGANQSTVEAIGIPNPFVLKRTLVGIATAIDVSPDGTKVAVVLNNHADQDRAYLEVVQPDKGLQAAVSVPTAKIGISGVSWQADSDRVTFSVEDRRSAAAGGYSWFRPPLRPISGIHGYIDADDLVEHVKINDTICGVSRGFALGVTGRFAVLAECPDFAGRLVIATTTVPVYPDRAVRSAAVVDQLPDGIKTSEILGVATSSDGAHLLISTKSGIWRIDGSHARRLGGFFGSPSWAMPTVVPSTSPTPPAQPTATPTIPDVGPSQPPVGTPPDVPGYPYVAGLVRQPGDLAYPPEAMQIFSATTGQRVGNSQVDNAEAVAQLPAGGWLVARYIGDRQRPDLVEIQPGGSTRALPITPLDGPVSEEMAVTADGTRVGVVTFPPSGALGSYTTTIEVINLSSGARQSWPLDVGKSPTGLSWSPDGRYLTFTTMSYGMGGPTAGGYQDIDTSQPPKSMSGAAGPDTFTLNGQLCRVDHGFWLGNTGRFAVLGECGQSVNAVLAVVPYSPAPATAVPAATQLLASLPGGVEGSGGRLCSTPDGRHLFIDATYDWRVDDGKVTRVNQSFDSATW
jgi:hypothetical protein